MDRDDKHSRDSNPAAHTNDQAAENPGEDSVGPDTQEYVPLQEICARWHRTKQFRNYREISIIYLIASIGACVIFIPLGGPVLPFICFVLLGVLAILIVVGVQALYAIRRGPAGFKCPCCGKHLSTLETWVCGYCDARNVTNLAGNYSIADKCATYKTVPKAYRCFHCQGVVFFDADLDGRHPAYAADRHAEPAAMDSWETKIANDLKELEGSGSHDVTLLQWLQTEIARITKDPTIHSTIKSTLIDRRQRWVNEKLRASSEHPLPKDS
jgi:hypothetical protein